MMSGSAKSYQTQREYEGKWVANIQLKRTHVAQILSGIRYMLENTGLVFALIIYKGATLLTSSMMYLIAEEL